MVKKYEDEFSKAEAKRLKKLKNYKKFKPYAPMETETRQSVLYLFIVEWNNHEVDRIYTTSLIEAAAIAKDKWTKYCTHGTLSIAQVVEECETGIEFVSMIELIKNGQVV